MIARLLKGFQSFRQAVNLAPEVWFAMLIRMLLKPEVHKFLLDIVTALFKHSRYRIPETFWLCLSRFLHRSENSEVTRT